MADQEIRSYRIGGMHCGACVNRVVKALREVPGVEEVTVDLETGEARIVVAPGQTVTETALAQAVMAAGYEFGGPVG